MRLTIWSAALLLAATLGARAQEAPPPDPRGVFGLILENDAAFSPLDPWYTSGLRLGWTSREDALPSPLASLDRQLSDGQGHAARSRWGLALGQRIYTPEDTALRDPDPRDRPYAGYLYGAVFLERRTERVRDLVELQLGVVGPSALGRQAQEMTHRVHGDRRPRGWSQQLRDEPVFDLLAERTWRVGLLGAGVEADLLPSVSLALGIVQTYAGAGARLRVGEGLAGDFSPPRVHPTIADGSMASAGEGFGWYDFAGAGGRAVAHDIFLDGNTWRDSRSVDRRPLVADLEAGVAITWHSYRIAYTHVWRSKELYGQREWSHFGSLTLSVPF